jgi:hypothetical protein
LGLSGEGFADEVQFSSAVRRSRSRPTPSARSSRGDDGRDHPALGTKPSVKILSDGEARGHDDPADGQRPHRSELVGEVVRYEDAYRLCYLRGPEGIMVALAEELS